MLLAWPCLARCCGAQAGHAIGERADVLFGMGLLHGGDQGVGLVGAIARELLAPLRFGRIVAVEPASSLTEPIITGTFFEIAGATSWKERTLMRFRPASAPRTRGVVGRARGRENPRQGGLCLAAAALRRSTADHSIFCSAAMSCGPMPSSLNTWRANSFDSSAVGIEAAGPTARRRDGTVPPPTACRATSQTLEPPPDWPVDHHAVGIAAEIGDVLVHPAQRRDQIGHADIDGILIGRAADLGDVESRARSAGD